MSDQNDLALDIRDNDDLSVNPSEAASQRSMRSKVSENKSQKSGKLTPITTVSVMKPIENPFKLRQNDDLFAYRDEEKKRKQEERMRQKTLKVHEKTYGMNNRLKFREVALLKDSGDEDSGDSRDQSLVVKEDPEFVISATKGRHTEKETLSDYITKKREMFLVQYSLGVKREEMRKLEEISLTEEKKLELAEQYLEEDAAIFDEFLKENDKNAVDAMTVAESESKERMKLVSDVKSLTTQLMQIKSEISKYEEQLSECKTYKRFLDKLVPETVRLEREAASAERKEVKRLQKERQHAEAKLAKERSDTSSQGSRRRSVSHRRSIEQPPKPLTVAIVKEPAVDDYSSDDSELELYFKEPQELLKIFTELEESNLSLIQTCQETEESLDELKQIRDATHMKMQKDTNILMLQIAKLEKSIEEETEKISDLEAKKSIFKSVKSIDHDEFLEKMHGKVQEVYKNTVTNTEAKMNTLDMLVRIEGQLESLFEAIDAMPAERVEAAQRRKDKERRRQMRDEAQQRKAADLEESKRKALERAKAPPKKQFGRRVIGRSEPPQLQQEDPVLNDRKNREEEELMYFFT